MNQKYFISKTLRSSTRSTETERSRVPFISKTLRSSARFTETERSRATSTILLFFLTLLLASPCFAWDDDDTDSKPFHRSNYNQQSSANDYGYKNNYQASSANDYGYKNPYQANSTHRSSAIDLGGPKRLAQADDDNDHGYKNSYQSSIKNPRESVSRERGEESKITLNTIEESVALRDRESREMMAESQRRFEKQEADQEKSRAQMAKQQEIYNKMDREEGEMAEFLGGVYKAKFGATTGRNSAVTTDGYVYRSGDTFVTPKGIYTKTGNTYAGPGSFTTQTGTLFFGNESTTIQAGGAYFSEGESGFIVSPNTSTWRTR